MNSNSGILFFCISMTLCLCGDREHHLDHCRQTFYSCESGSKNIYCSCDRMCFYYDNCCFDAGIMKGELKEMNDEDQHYLKKTTCEMIAFREKNILRQGAFMISSCPDSWDSDMDTRQACELYTETDVRDILPVVDTSANLTFKNHHCAKCHGVQNYIPWLVEIECFPESYPPSISAFEAVMAKLHSDRCSYRFVPPNGVTVYYCYQEFDYMIISNSSEIDNNSTCRNRVFSPVLIEQGQNIRYFRTLQCLIDIEGPKYQEVLDVTSCVSSFQDGMGFPFTLSNLIDFSAVFRQRETKCKDEEIELCNKIGCRRLYCPARSEPSGGECVDMRYTNDGFVLELLFEVNKDSKTDRTLYKSLLNIVESLITALRNNTGSLLKYHTISLKYPDIISGITRNSEEVCSVIHLYLHVKGIEITSDKLESERSWTAKYFHNFTVRNKDGGVIRHIADIQNMSCKTNISFRNPLYLREMISVDNDLPCPAVKLQYSRSESNSEVEMKNASHLYFHLQKISISPLDVVFANGDYFLCIETFYSKYQLNYQHHDTMDSYRSYINTACASISIICMIYCLIQFCVIPIFRDGKSDLLIVLLLFLLLAQTCFFLFSHFEIQTTICEWVGVIHHFTWLGAFVFMFLCPYRFNAEIRDLQTYSRYERMKGTLKYILVGVTLPLFVIIFIKITNLILAPTEKWYGGRLCFITQTYVVLFGIVVPVFSILCGNAFLFICIIRYISSTSISANSNKSNAIVFIKISTIMGFSWIIGIVAMLSQSDVLLLVFEVLANLQGAFITLSFSCTNRVRSFYKGCFQRVKNKCSTQNTTS